MTLPWRCLSSRKHHQPWLASKKLNDINAVEVAYTKVLNVCVHSWAASAEPADLRAPQSAQAGGAVDSKLTILAAPAGGSLIELAH